MDILCKLVLKAFYIKHSWTDCHQNTWFWSWIVQCSTSPRSSRSWLHQMLPQILVLDFTRHWSL